LDCFTEYISGGTLRQVLKDKVRKDSTCIVPTESYLRSSTNMIIVNWGITVSQHVHCAWVFVTMTCRHGFDLSSFASLASVCPLPLLAFGPWKAYFQLVFFVFFNFSQRDHWDRFQGEVIHDNKNASENMFYIYTYSLLNC